MLSCPARLWMEQLGILGKELHLELVQVGCNILASTVLPEWLPTCLRLKVFPGKNKTRLASHLEEN